MDHIHRARILDGPIPSGGSRTVRWESHNHDCKGVGGSPMITKRQALVTMADGRPTVYMQKLTTMVVCFDKDLNAVSLELPSPSITNTMREAATIALARVLVGHTRE